MDEADVQSMQERMDLEYEVALADTNSLLRHGGLATDFCRKMQTACEKLATYEELRRSINDDGDDKELKLKIMKLSFQGLESGFSALATFIDTNPFSSIQEPDLKNRFEYGRRYKSLLGDLLVGLREELAKL